MPPLHIKLGLIKQFVKTLDFESEAFKYLQKIFPGLTPAKIKGGIFTGPQINKLLQCNEFSCLLSKTELNAWESFKSIVRGFLGNYKDTNYEKIITELIANYEKMGCRMSLKLHILDCHLDRFKENMGQYSEEQGERFHQDIKIFEERYKGHSTPSMLGDYIWSIVRSSEARHKRKPRSNMAGEPGPTFYTSPSDRSTKG